MAGGPRIAFRGRGRRSGRFYFDVQVSWQAQHVGHGDGLRRALIAWRPKIAGKCRAKIVFWYLMLFLEMFLPPSGLTVPRDVNLATRIRGRPIGPRGL